MSAHPAPVRAGRGAARAAARADGPVTGPSGYGPRLSARLKTAGIPIGPVRHLAAANVPAPFLEDLLNTPGLACADDARALLLFLTSEFDQDEILAWARLGSLTEAARLMSRDLTPAVAASFTLDPTRGLKDLVRVVQVAHEHGMRMEDLPLWVAGGALSLTAPHYVDAVFAPWRATGVHHLGMRRAALACGAGLTAREAIDMFTAGTFDEETLRLMAAFRGSDRSSGR